MKKNIYFRLLGAMLGIASILSSCSLDNFDGPDAQIYGEVRDAETGELIQQDISGGSMIRYIEYGYENPDRQQMNFKVDGTYRNNIMFSGTYDFYFEETNFQIPDTLKAYKIKKGSNELNFEVTPYVRVTNVSITKDGDTVHATFTITPTVSDNVRQIGLFAHPDFIVGNNYATARTTQDINESFSGESREYSLDLNTSSFTTGKPYYGTLANFRGIM